jgi:hypothetical protein
MPVEDELVQELVRLFQQLLQTMDRIRNLSRGQQGRILREASSEFLKNDPRADAARQQLTGQTFEQLVAREVNRILDERFGSENAAEQSRDPQQVEAPEAEQGGQAETPGAETPGAETPGAEAPEVEAAEVEAAEVGQRGSLLEQGDDGQAVVSPVIGGEGPQAEAAEVGQPGSLLEQGDDGQAVVSPVIGAEELQAEGAGQESGFLKQAGDGQLVSPAVIGEDNPGPAAGQDNNPIFNQLVREQAERQALEQRANNPIFNQLMSEQAERQGQQRPEGEQAAAPAGDDQAATGDAANKPEGQAAAAQDPGLSADMQKLQGLQNGGRPSATGAAQRPDGPPAASPHAGATSGAHRRAPSKDSGGRGD